MFRKRIKDRDLELVLLLYVPLMAIHQDDCSAICDSISWSKLLAKDNKNIHVENVVCVLQTQEGEKRDIFANPA